MAHAGSSAILRFSSNQIIKIPINTGFPILVNDKIRMFAEEPLSPDSRDTEPGLFMKLLLYNGTQSVNGFAHIRSACYDIDFIGGCDIP